MGRNKNFYYQSTLTETGNKRFGEDYRTGPPAKMWNFGEIRLCTYSKYY